MEAIPSHEVVGARVVGELPSADMVDLWGRISSGIVKYGLDRVRDSNRRVQHFYGLLITLDPDVGFEMLLLRLRCSDTCAVGARTRADGRRDPHISDVALPECAA